MKNRLHKIAFGGGCHWCTEAVFQSLKGVEKVEQGFVSSIDEHTAFSEAVILHFNSETIDLRVLLEIHLHTHKSRSNHSMRKKYRSAVYVFDMSQKEEVAGLMDDFQIVYKGELVTKVLQFNAFKPSEKQFQNYYAKNSEKPFCKRYINPKLKLLQKQFSRHMHTKNKSHQS